MIDFFALAVQCAPNVAPQTMAAVVSVESSHNPFAIGVVGGQLARQPTTLQEAVATAKELERNGRNFSVGIAQVNRYNLPKYQLTYEQAFDACKNLRVAGLILGECYGRAVAQNMPPQMALRAAFSCYYSGNFTRGFRPDPGHQLSYVDKVVAAAGGQQRPVQVPAVDVSVWATGGAAQTAPPARPLGGGVMIVKDANEVAQETEAATQPATQPTAERQSAAPIPAPPPNTRQSTLVF